jgi:hypothetical protein
MCDTRLNDAWDANAGASKSANESGYSTYGERARAASTEIPRTRFKGVGDVLGPTLEIYRKNFLLIIILVVVATLPEVLLQYGLLQAVTHAPDEASAYAIVGTVVIWLITIAGSALLSGSLVYAVMDLQTAGASSAGASLRRGLRALPKVFRIQFMYSIVVFIGCLLLVVPGIILSLAFSLVIPVAIAEGRGPIDSFKRSLELTSGYKGLIFLTFFLWEIATIVIAFVISGSFSYGGPQDAFLVMLVNALVTGILNSSTAVLTVFIYLGILHERRQGFDTRAFTSAPGPSER